MEQALMNAYRWHRQHGTHATRAVEYARDDMNKGKARYPHSVSKFGFCEGNWQSLESMERNVSRAYYCNDWPAWRNLGNVGEIKTESTYRGRFVEHTGWYVQDDGGDTIAGYVLQLPSRNGSPVYIPGMRQTDYDGVTIYPLDQYDEISACARAADRIAENAAEKERDYERAWRAGTDAKERLMTRL